MDDARTTISAMSIPITCTDPIARHAEYDKLH